MKNNSDDTPPYLLLTPGPVSIPDSILNILANPMIHHRSDLFKNILKKTLCLLKKMFQTQQDVLILNSSGTGAMSAALLNTLSAGDTVLTLSAGKFGKRWAQIATAYKLQVIVLDIPLGKAACPQKVETLLNQNPQIKAVLTQACETSTGVLHPIKSLSAIIQKKPNTLFIVDAISALGAVDIPMDKWGIDILIGGSQKTFCLPAGMSFIALSKKAWQFNQQAQLPVFYFNLKQERQAQTKGQTLFSSNVSFIKALHEYLSPLETKKGLLSLRQKSVELAQITKQFCQKWNLKLFADFPSPSVTSITLPLHIDGVKLQKQIEKNHKVVFGGGQNQLKGRIIRVGHLGNISKTDLRRGLHCLFLELQLMDPILFTSPSKIKDL